MRGFFTAFRMTAWAGLAGRVGTGAWGWRIGSGRRGWGRRGGWGRDGVGGAGGLGRDGVVVVG